MKTITELTIDRKQWLRGEGPGTLLNKHDKMCCLGFFSIACGIDKGSILHVRTPQSLSYRKSTVIEQLTCKVENNVLNNEIADKLMNTNDSRELTEEDREKEIARLMLQLNPPVKVTFIN